MSEDRDDESNPWIDLIIGITTVLAAIGGLLVWLLQMM